MIDDNKRIDVLHDLAALDSGKEKVFDDLVQLTAELCDAPVCLISLVEKDRQWFKSEIGLGICETKIEQSICAHAIAQDGYLEIEDTHLDKRTIGNTLCQGDKPVRFYAGALLRTVEGWPLGTLCVLDYQPRRLSELQKRVLKIHAVSVTRQLEFTRALYENAAEKKKSSETNSMSAFEEERTKKTNARYGKLTPREREIMLLILERPGNMSSKQIARELNISPRTVDHHRANILLKMQVGSVAELISVSLKAKLV